MSPLAPIRDVVKTKLGVSPSPATLWRWVNKGVGGCRLRAVRCGKRLLCAPEWVDQFVTAQQQATASPEPASPTSPRTTDEAAALRAAGLLPN